MKCISSEMAYMVTWWETQSIRHWLIFDCILVLICVSFAYDLTSLEMENIFFFGKINQPKIIQKGKKCQLDGNKSQWFFRAMKFVEGILFLCMCCLAVQHYTLSAFGSLSLQEHQITYVSWCQETDYFSERHFYTTCLQIPGYKTK